jgi:diguanylate cyclase (GGDEF)-like protein
MAPSVPDQAELVDRTIASGFAWLTFPRELEVRFLREGAPKRFLLMVIAGLASILLFAGVSIADFLLAPDVLPLALVIRGVVYGPVIVAGLLTIRRLNKPALNERLVAAAGVWATLLQSVIILHSAGSLAVARVVELNIIVVYTCALARFWPAVALSAVVAFMHTAIVLTMPDGTGGILAPTTTLLMVTSMAFVLYGNYKLEHDERMAFLLDAREQALHAELTAANERLTHMATTDALTHLANRRYFERFLGECWQRAQAQRRVLSVMVLDVDDFKRYNDLYGHQAGDRCLVGVAQALSSSIRRPGDLVARWGGEEFVIVMMDTDVEAAAAAVERIREAVAQLDLPHQGSRCSTRVTLSGGCATSRPDAHAEWPQLVQLADEALYRAKAGGRNRIVVTCDGSGPSEKAKAVR